MLIQEFALELAFPDARATAGLQRVMAKFRPAATETLAEGMPAIGIPGFVPWQNKMPNYFFATITMKVGHGAVARFSEADTVECLRRVLHAASAALLQIQIDSDLRPAMLCCRRCPASTECWTA